MDILSGKKVVLIEDNELLSEIILRKLKTIGVDARHYNNGEEGMEGIRTEKPDLILLDIMLPMMNGYEILQAMNTENLIKKHPVLVISNSGQPVEIARVLELGAKDYLIKADFSPDEVFEKARIILQGEHNSTKVLADDFLAKNTGIGDVSDTEENPMKVLIVEDDPMLRNILSMKFNHHPLMYMFVSDGSQAVETANLFKPDVIVLDLMLPGISGFEIFEQINKTPELKGIPVIIFSNKSEEADKRRALELGAVKYLVKATTDLNDLIDLMKKLTLKRRQSLN